MLFKEYHIEQIRNGEKTVTRRDWKDTYSGPNVGSVIAAKTDLLKPDDECDCFIRIMGRYEQPLGEMTDEDAQKEGDYETLDEFKESWREINDEGWDPEKVVDVVQFEYVGKQPTPVLIGVPVGECPDCEERFEYATADSEIGNLDPCPQCGSRAWVKWGYSLPSGREIPKEDFER